MAQSGSATKRVVARLHSFNIVGVTSVSLSGNVISATPVSINSREALGDLDIITQASVRLNSGEALRDLDVISPTSVSINRRSTLRNIVGEA